jgi:hypothetical protein
MSPNAFSHHTNIDPEERLEITSSNIPQSEALSELFPGYDRQQEIAQHDPNQQAIDPDSTINREQIQQQSKQAPLYGNPLLKLGAVGGIIATVIGLPAYLYIQANSPPTTVASAEVEKPKAAEFQNPTVAESDARGEIALGKQIEDLKLGTPAAAATIPAKGTAPVATSTATPQAKPPETATPQAVKPAYKPKPPVVATNYPKIDTYRTAAPQPIARYQPVAQTPKPQPKPVAQPNAPRIAQAPQPIVQATRSIPTPPTVLAYNPPRSIPTASTTEPGQDIAAWKAASTSGSFGGSIDRVGNTPVAQIQPTAPTAPLPRQEIRQTKTLSVGSKSIGNTTTPIQLAAGNPAGGTVSVSLQQPLLDRTGAILVPGGSQVEFRIQPLDNGWLNATSTKIYLSNGAEIDANGAISLSSQNGEPLIADSRGINNNAVANQEAKSFVIGALQNLGANLTQPTTQSTVNAGINGVNSSTSTQSNSNPFGALIKGGFDPLAQQQLARANAATQELLRASKIWYLPDGTVVRLTVVKPLAVTIQ